MLLFSLVWRLGFLNPSDAEICVYTSWITKHCFQFEISTNVLVSSFRFIWIPMIWVYGSIQIFNTFSAVTVFRRQNLTSIDVSFWPQWTLHQALGEYWTKVFEYKYKYLKKWWVQVQVLDFQKYLSTSTSTSKSTRVQVPSTLVVNSN